MDRAELRRLAEVARKFYEKAVYDADESQTWEDFVEYCNPAAIIELLDEIAAANARIAEIEKSNKKWSIVVDDLKQLSETDKQRAEQAEAQAAAFQDQLREITKLEQGREMSYSFVLARKIAMDALTGQTVLLRKNFLLARMERMREALQTIRRCVSTCNTPIETVNAMDRIAAEALEGLLDKEEKQ